MSNYKMEINQNNGVWSADLLVQSEIGGVDVWETLDRVIANSYLDLQKEIGANNFFEKLNQNKY